MITDPGSRPRSPRYSGVACPAQGGSPLVFRSGNTGCRLGVSELLAIVHSIARCGPRYTETMLANDTQQLIGPDLVLLLLRAPATSPSAQDRVYGITRLEKLLFLADKESKLPGQVEEAFEFKAYNYGPYSKQIYEAVEVLEEAKLLREEKVLDGRSVDIMEERGADAGADEGLERRFYLTDDGKDVADLLAGAHGEFLELFTSIKRKYADMPLRQLIQYVYRAYPDYAENSLIRDRVF